MNEEDGRSLLSSREESDSLERGEASRDDSVLGRRTSPTSVKEEDDVRSPGLRARWEALCSFCCFISTAPGTGPGDMDWPRLMVSSVGDGGRRA